MSGSIACTNRVPQLSQLFGDLVEYLIGIRPVESTPRGSTLKFHGTGQGRQRNGDVVQQAALASAPGPLSRLHLLPLLRLLLRISFLHVAENVRVTSNHLARDCVDDFLETELARFAGDLRVEHDLEEQVAELVPKI